MEGWPLKPADGGHAHPEVRFHGLNAAGEGVGRLPTGKVVFVPRAAPGDRAEVEVTQERDRHAAGRLHRLLEPSADRVDPPCPLYDRCGGCSLQHIDYAAQCRLKGERVGQALKRIGSLTQDPGAARPAPKPLRYRNRLTFHLRRLSQKGVVAGFHRFDSPGHIVDVPDCLLAEDVLARTWKELRAAWGPGASRLPAGPELELTVRSTHSGAVLTVHGGSDPGDPDALLEAVPTLRAIWWRRASRRQGGAAAPRLLAGEPVIEDRWQGRGLMVGATGFAQANRAAAAHLEAAVLQAAEPAGDRHVVDAYCGAGLWGRALVQRGDRVTGIELDPDAVRAARAGAPEGQKVVEGRVEEVLPGALPADLVIVNPPRQGLHRDVAEALVHEPPPAVIYVSCDPATLARDLKRLSDRYEVVTLEALDLFPQTAHVETVVRLGRAAQVGSAHQGARRDP